MQNADRFVRSDRHFVSLKKEELVSNLKWKRDATKAVNSLQPILVKGRINNAVMSRSMIEAMFIGNNSDVRKATEENQSAKLILFFGTCRSKTSKECSCTTSFEINAHTLENAPDKTGTIKGSRSCCPPPVMCTEPVINCC